MFGRRHDSGGDEILEIFFILFLLFICVPFIGLYWIIFKRDMAHKIAGVIYIVVFVVIWTWIKCL